MESNQVYDDFYVQLDRSLDTLFESDLRIRGSFANTKTLFVEDDPLY